MVFRLPPESVTSMARVGRKRKKPQPIVCSNATPVQQIERFYARHLPLSKEMAINLQSFGEDGG